jgi:hypothetical protein
MLLFFCISVEAQDSLKLYRNIKKLAYKSRVTKLVYDALFVDPEPKDYPAPASPAEKHVNPYLLHEGKVIRNIQITVYDPFGYSVADSMPRKINWSQRVGNGVHITTRKWVVNNRLLFKKNERLNALKLSESERVLREAVFINDARIVSVAHGDSVDVFVYVHDKWPVTIPLEVTDMVANARLKSHNLFGLGQQFEQYAGFSRPDIFDYNGYYAISNIDNTFISSRLGYQTNVNGTSAYLDFDRPFYSPLARWAAGLNISHAWRDFKKTDSIIGPLVYPVNVIGYDVYAMHTLKPRTPRIMFNQSSNYILGARLFNYIHYQKQPRWVDSLGNLNAVACIVNAGFAIQQFYKDKYIYRFGANEDVPEGLIIQTNFGILKREEKHLRFYNGIEIARARHFGRSYLSATTAFGVFYNPEVTNDITASFNLNYFSDLIRVNRWYFRQFFYYKAVYGEHKLDGETITLSSDELYGFSNGTLSGTTKMVFNSETVAYMPYNIIGFRLAPVFLAGMGIIGNKDVPLEKSLLYQGYALGMMFRNENLLTSTFQVSFGMYPFLPEGSTYVFKYNPVTSFTLKIRGFSVSRPDFVGY